MRNLFHMTLLLMLSLPSFANGVSLSTLSPTVFLGKSLSPTLYRNVMDNIVMIQQTCAAEPERKAGNLDRLYRRSTSDNEELGSEQEPGTSNNKENELTIKEFENLKSQVENTPHSIIASLESQQQKLNGLKEMFQNTPLCSLEKLGLYIPGFSNLTDSTSIQGQIDFAVNYLELIKQEVEKAKEWRKIENGVKFNEVTDREREIYKYCSDQLLAVIKEFNYEK